MAIYYFMIGIPASGKSYYIQQHLPYCELVDTMLIREVHKATNTLRKDRQAMILAGKPYADRVICVWMDTPLALCIAWHKERMMRGMRTQLPVGVIERMAAQLADNPAELSEGFDEIRRIRPEDLREQK